MKDDDLVTVFLCRYNRDSLKVSLELATVLYGQKSKPVR